MSLTLTFTPTLASNQIQVALSEDLDSEGIEEFFLQVVLVDEQLGLPGLVVEARVFIFDNESKYELPPASRTFIINPLTIAISYGG